MDEMKIKPCFKFLFSICVIYFLIGNLAIGANEAETMESEWMKATTNFKENTKEDYFERIRLFEKLWISKSEEDRRSELNRILSLALKDDNVALSEFKWLVTGRSILDYLETGKSGLVRRIIKIKCPTDYAIKDIALILCESKTKDAILLLFDGYENSKNKVNKGIIFNLIHDAFPSLPKAEAEKLTQAQYLNRCREWYLANRERIVVNHQFGLSAAASPEFPNDELLGIQKGSE